MTTDDAGARPAPMIPGRTSGIARRLIPAGAGVAALGLVILLILPRSAIGSVLLTLGAAALSWALLHDALDGRVADVVRWGVLLIVVVLAVVMLVRLLALPWIAA